MTKRAVALTSLPKAAYFYDEKLKQKLLPPPYSPSRGGQGVVSSWKGTKDGTLEAHCSL